MTTTEKVAYLKGLTDGFGIDKESKEGKLLNVVIDILDEITHDIEDLEANSYELGEAIDQVSDDLADIEEFFLDEDEDDEDDDDDDDDECSCGCCGDEDLVFYEVTCPACENTITIDEDVLDLGSIECPNCGETLEFEGVEIEDEDDEDEVEDND